MQLYYLVIHNLIIIIIIIISKYKLKCNVIIILPSHYGALWCYEQSLLGSLQHLFHDFGYVYIVLSIFFQKFGSTLVFFFCWMAHLYNFKSILLDLHLDCRITSWSRLFWVYYWKLNIYNITHVYIQ